MQKNILSTVRPLPPHPNPRPQGGEGTGNRNREIVPRLKRTAVQPNLSGIFDWVISRKIERLHSMALAIDDADEDHRLAFGDGRESATPHTHIDVRNVASEAGGLIRID